MILDYKTLKYSSLLSLLQAYSCEKWRSSESKRLNTSGSATTWPPSCRGASLWSTPTQRTSPSLTKETGWSDVGREDGEKKGQNCSGATPQNPALHTSPSESLLLRKEEERRGGFFLLSRVSLWFVFGGQSPHHPCPSFQCSKRGYFAFVLFFSALPRDFVSAGFLMMKSMFTIVIHNFFEEPLVFISYLYIDIYIYI